MPQQLIGLKSLLGPIVLTSSYQAYHLQRRPMANQVKEVDFCPSEVDLEAVTTHYFVELVSPGQGRPAMCSRTHMGLAIRTTEVFPQVLNDLGLGVCATQDALEVVWRGMAQVYMRSHQRCFLLLR